MLVLQQFMDWILLSSSHKIIQRRPISGKSKQGVEVFICQRLAQSVLVSESNMKKILLLSNKGCHLTGNPFDNRVQDSRQSSIELP